MQHTWNRSTRNNSARGQVFWAFALFELLLNVSLKFHFKLISAATRDFILFAGLKSGLLIARGGLFAAGGQETRVACHSGAKSVSVGVALGAGQNFLIDTRAHQNSGSVIGQAACQSKCTPRLALQGVIFRPGSSPIYTQNYPRAYALSFLMRICTSSWELAFAVCFLVIICQVAFTASLDDASLQYPSYIVRSKFWWQ